MSHANGLHSTNRFKLGLFGLNVDNACAITTIDGVFRPTWDNVKRADPHGRQRGLRGAGSGCALARLRRRHQFQRRLFRDFHLGRRCRRRHGARGGVRNLARADPPSDRRRQAGDDDRPHHQRPFRAERRLRLVRARAGDVRRPDHGARRALRLRHRMAGCLEAALDGRGRVRLRRPLFPHQARLPPAQADPEAVSRRS